MAVIPRAHAAFIWTRGRPFKGGESLKVREAGRRHGGRGAGRGHITPAAARLAAAWYSRGLVKASTGGRNGLGVGEPCVLVGVHGVGGRNTSIRKGK